MMKNFTHLRKILLQGQPRFSNFFFLKQIMTVPSFNFATERRGRSMVDEILSQQKEEQEEDNIKKESILEEPIRESIEEVPQPEVQEKTPSPTGRITSKVLCELIGCKHYPSNEEIPFDKDRLVSVYDENDKQLGTMSLEAAFEYGSSLKKDVVLRNEKSVPPIVKIIKYKVDLVKKLFKKIGKRLGREIVGTKEDIKYMTFGLKTDEADFKTKLEKIKEMLSSHAIVKVIIPCNLEDTNESTKAISILKNLAQELLEFATIKAGPVKQKQRKENMEEIARNKSVPQEELDKEDKLNKKTFKEKKIEEIKNEKDLDYMSCAYIEFESLLVDNTGINYESLLESANIEDLIKGVTHTNVMSEMITENKNKAHPMSVEAQIQKGISKLKESDEVIDIKKKIEKLETQVVYEKDRAKRIEMKIKLGSLYREIVTNEIKMTSKAIKLKMFLINKRAYLRSGMKNKQK